MVMAFEINRVKAVWSAVMDHFNYTIGSLFAFAAIIALLLKWIDAVTFGAILAASFRVSKMRFKTQTKNKTRP